ncbi:MAG: site-specific DNA-methyltransferase [Candidatus Brocadiia bacterium]
MSHTDPKDNQILKLQKENERLKKQLTKFSKEIYGLFWFDVPEAFEDDIENKLPILEEVPKLAIKSKDDKPTHILIDGDNYHVLTCLNYTHKGKIDVIYIDPPYNTGSDGFKYKDKRILDKYPDGTEVPIDHPLRHSYWLSFIRKRLELSKTLLSKDGFLSVSIDDNEYAQLKLLLDSIFQENVKTIVVKMSEASGLKMASIKKAGSIPKYKEYLLIAKPFGVKNLSFEPIAKEKWDNEYNIFIDNFSKEKRDIIAEISTKVNIIDADIKMVDKILAEIELKTLSAKIDEIGIKNKKEVEFWRLQNAWRICRTAAGDSVKQLADKKRRTVKQTIFSVISKRDKVLYIVKADYPENSKKPRVQILFADDYLNVHPGDLWTDIKTTGLEAEGGIDFKNGKKPLQLLKRIIAANKNKNAIILDFFAGSGTTGEAVMELNEIDKGRRQFILVNNNDEVINGNRHRIMTDVCYPRIKNVINGYNNKKALGNSIKYYKTNFVGKNNILSANDKDKIELAYNAGAMLAIAENTLEEVEKNGYYQLFENEERYTAVYFREELDKFDFFVTKVSELKKPVVIYVFSWEKELEFSEFENNKNIAVKTIPQPILEIYKQIYNLT